MARLDAVQEKLAQDERELQAEIDALQEALKRDQDPGRMQLIQEMIFVQVSLLWIYIDCLNLLCRISSGKCRAYAKRRRNQKP